MRDYDSKSETVIVNLDTIEEVNELRKRIRNANIEKGLWFIIYQPTKSQGGWDFCVANTWGGRISIDVALSCMEIATDVLEEFENKEPLKTFEDDNL